MTPTSDSLVLQDPGPEAQQLMLLFHGAGAQPADLEPLGRHVAACFPRAFIVCVAAPGTDGPDGGRRWFAEDASSDGDLPVRVRAALPAFVETVRHWQSVSGVGAAATALFGFAQGATMALEAAGAESAPLAGRVVGLSGRFAARPMAAASGVVYHLFHGKADPVVPYRHTVAAAERLIDLGGDVTADVLPFVGHAVTPEIAELVTLRLQTYLPRSAWEQVQAADPGAAGPGSPVH
jgi:phospholipase/carboxylesterase